jgi:hypothetical protein
LIPPVSTCSLMLCHDTPCSVVCGCGLSANRIARACHRTTLVRALTRLGETFGVFALCLVEADVADGAHVTEGMCRGRGRVYCEHPSVLRAVLLRTPFSALLMSLILPQASNKPQSGSRSLMCPSILHRRHPPRRELLSVQPPPLRHSQSRCSSS